ncbi:helix-turn-helix transcriptional regulator [Demequina zhanjiangensis]|uniref:Helix-turn-helix transcriptional regulator n=1 Tax=Demequina zhanjiangensis TaxID=3051659 RepID=A0ABT8G0H3_9MICO|nr:helix-turn-helix transcriptional regulator [Demequina sp. SYSU T00b26]MDN4472587.1 helix-turn-helix transcriptional regulator [Demequina sp. SYSU T00b26]
MSNSKEEVREFLVTRRAKVTPEMAGLPAAGNRRVPGLRRGEVAVLAGVSVEYYTKLERGDLRGVSDEVLEAIASALRFTEAERMHLFDLARAANAGSRARKRPAPRTGVRPSLLHLVASISDGAAVLGDRRSTIIATNALARAMYDPLFRALGDTVNYSRFIFFDPSARQFYPDWDEIADGAVASLRTVAGRNPFDRQVTDLVGELSTRSEEFRTRWARHDVRLHIEGIKRVRHPAVGMLELEYNTLALPGDEDLGLTVYTAAPESESYEKLSLLASWWASETVEQEKNVFLHS